eukprot:SAG31_NODE_46926_length_252_cov_0.849673_1_plen_49_part_01
MLIPADIYGRYIQPYKADKIELVLSVSVRLVFGCRRIIKKLGTVLVGLG